MMHDLIIVQCVKSKIWDKDKTASRFVPVKTAYVSSYFKKMKAFAEKYGKRWCVLSSKYGFLLPTTEIEDYNASFINPQSNPIPIEDIKKNLKKNKALKEHLKLETANSCAILGSKDYVKVAKAVLSDYQLDIVDLLAGFKIGEKLRWLDEKVTAENRVYQGNIFKNKTKSRPGIYCIFCGQMLPVEAKFCLRCGKKLPDTSTLKQKSSLLESISGKTSVSEETARKVTNILKKYHKELYQGIFSTVDRLKTAGLAKDPEDNQFLIDNPNAFLFGVIFDQQIRAERAWIAPRKLYKRLGNTLNLREIIKIGPEKLAEILHQPPALHRFCNKLGRWLVEAASILINKYEGKAENIWGSKRIKALEVIQRLNEFPGISQKKANMTLSILIRDFKVPIMGWEEIDIPYDRHIRRVFLRTGLIKNDTGTEVIVVGRRYSPDYPGELDLPTWYIGRDWCHPRRPECLNCKLSSVCPKYGGRSVAG